MDVPSSSRNIEILHPDWNIYKAEIMKALEKPSAKNDRPELRFERDEGKPVALSFPIFMILKLLP